MEKWGLFVKYSGDDYYTRILSAEATGTMERVATYLAENYRHIVRLGGADKIKIKRVKKI